MGDNPDEGIEYRHKNAGCEHRNRLWPPRHEGDHAPNPAECPDKVSPYHHVDKSQNVGTHDESERFPCSNIIVSFGMIRGVDPVERDEDGLRKCTEEDNKEEEAHWCMYGHRVHWAVRGDRIPEQGEVDPEDQQEDQREDDRGREEELEGEYD